MKKAADFVKQIINMLTSMAKDKTKEMKRKTKAFKTRLVIFSLLHNRSMVLNSLSHKLKTKPTSRKLDQDVQEVHDIDHHRQNMVVVYSHNAMSSTPNASPHVQYQYTNEEDEDEEEEEEEEKYPDLRHTLFETEGSVIDMVKHSKEDKGEEFRLEDEIDKVADLFITRFHRQMWLQKQHSLDGQET